MYISKYTWLYIVLFYKYICNLYTDRHIWYAILQNTIEVIEFYMYSTQGLLMNNCLLENWALLYISFDSYALIFPQKIAKSSQFRIE